MSNTQDLFTTALIGTRRREVKPAGDNTPLGQAISRFQPQNKAELLLGIVAINSIFRAAGGGVPGTDWVVPSGHPADQSPTVAPEAVQRLKQILEGKFQNILPEWLELLQQCQRRVPEEFLPAVLEFGLQHLPVQRVLSREMIGERGKYLAQLNPNWGYVLGVIDEGLWQFGSKTQRLQYLRQMRKRDPHKATEMLTEVWANEAPEVRVEFLDTLSNGLNIGDEPFLESALEDKDERVQYNAASMLGRLPNSALVARMHARLDPILSLEQVPVRGFGGSASSPRPTPSGEALKPEKLPNWSNGLRSALGESGKTSEEPESVQASGRIGDTSPSNPTSGWASSRPGSAPSAPFRPSTNTPPATRAAVMVKLPENLDQNMKRDGVRAIPSRIPSDRTSEKHQWLRYMVAFVPPEYWRRKFDLNFPDLIEAAKAGNAGPSLIGGWQTAARYFQDEDMIEALLDTVINPVSSFGVFGGYQIDVRSLIASLSPQRRESFLQQSFTKRAPLAFDRQGLIMLECCTHSWSRDFSLFICQQIGASLTMTNVNQIWSRRRVASGGALTDTTWSWWNWFGLYIAPEAAEEIEAMLSPVRAKAPAFNEVLLMFIELLRFRSEMRKELGL